MYRFAAALPFTRRARFDFRAVPLRRFLGADDFEARRLRFGPLLRLTPAARITVLRVAAVTSPIIGSTPGFLPFAISHRRLLVARARPGRVAVA